MVALLALSLSACTTSAPQADRSGEHPTEGPRTTTYVAPAGWSVEIPVGWHVLPFETAKRNASSVGTQISNVELPAPSIEPGLPIQASGLVLPPRGVAVIIAADEDPASGQPAPAAPPSPPLSYSQFNQGSSPGGAPSLALLWFAGGGRTLLFSIKIGCEISEADQIAMEALIASLHFDTS